MSKPARTKKAVRPDEEGPGVLQEFLDKHGITQEQFGQMFKPTVTQGSVWQWLQWLANPKKGTRITAERANEIEEVTRGEVKRHQLRPDLYKREVKEEAA